MNPTRAQIINIAEELFSTQRYDQVSVAHICRRVGIANSVYYYYFQNKEMLFREILDGLFNNLDDAFGGIHGESLDERLNSMVDIHLHMEETRSRELAIYREGEFRFPGYDHALRAIYHSSLELVFDRPVSLAEYYYVYGGLRFLTLRLGAAELRRQRGGLFTIIREGIFRDVPVQNSSNPGDGFNFSDCDDRLPAIGGQEVDGTGSDDGGTGDSRQRMIMAGLELIGDRGYYNTQISDITRRAGCSVGLFYKKFQNKENFLELLLEQLGSAMRCCLKTQELTSGRRCYMDLHGIQVFLEFFRLRPYLFNLLQEAQFTSPRGIAHFYDRLEAGYAAGLGGSTFADTRLSANFLIGIADYLGGEVLFADDPPLPSNILPELSRLLRQGMTGMN